MVVDKGLGGTVAVAVAEHLTVVVVRACRTAFVV